MKLQQNQIPAQLSSYVANTTNLQKQLHLKCMHFVSYSNINIWFANKKTSKMLIKGNLLFSKTLVLRLNYKRNIGIYNMKFSGYISNQTFSAIFFITFRNYFPLNFHDCSFKILPRKN